MFSLLYQKQIILLVYFLIQKKKKIFKNSSTILKEFSVVFSDNNPVDNTNCIQIPTSIENLIDLVAENGDAYEETLRGLKNQLHPALW